MTQHSKLGASSANRWLNCPGSVQLSETIPPQPSSAYALEGTAAHKLAEICLIQGKNPKDLIGEPIRLNDEAKKIEDLYVVSEDMAEAVEVYVNYIRKLRGELSVEMQFNLNFIEEGMFGTNDACVYNRQLGMLEVLDYKHGAGVPVSPVENAQLAYYGLGAAKIYELHPNSTIKLTIVQPRAAGEAIKSWVTTVGYLENFAKLLKKGAKATRAKNPKLVEGSWCKFCPAQAVCPQLYNRSLEIAKADFADDGQLVLPAPESLEKNFVQKILDFSDILKSWLNAVEVYAYTMLERGEKIEGYKLVKKRANRKWNTSDEAVIGAITHLTGIDASKLYSEPKIKSPAQIEALKIDKNLVASLCETPDNGNTMVPISDKRPEVLPSIQTDFEAIEIQE